MTWHITYFTRSHVDLRRRNSFCILLQISKYVVYGFSLSSVFFSPKILFGKAQLYTLPCKLKSLTCSCKYLPFFWFSNFSHISLSWFGCRCRCRWWNFLYLLFSIPISIYGWKKAAAHSRAWPRLGWTLNWNSQMIFIGIKPSEIALSSRFFFNSLFVNK